MKRMLSILAFLALSIPSAACAEWALVRGSGNVGAFESTARPTVAVKTSPDFSAVAQGKMTVMLSTDRELPRSEPGVVWYSLSAKSGAQLAVALADAGSKYWYPGIMSTNLEFLPVLYTCGGDRPETVTQRVFVRPVQLDPWMPAFAERGMGWTAGVMVSQYEWIVNNGESKLLVEYREPLATRTLPHRGRRRTQGIRAARRHGLFSQIRGKRRHFCRHGAALRLGGFRRIVQTAEHGARLYHG